jgi:hypothetical protein
LLRKFSAFTNFGFMGYGNKRIIAFGFSAIGKLSVHRLPNQALKLTEWAWEQFSLRVKSEWNWKEPA